MEQLINFLVFLLAGYGFTNIVVNGDIFEGLKSRIKQDSIRFMLDCMMCAGFWVGLLTALFFGINPLVGGFVISGFSSLIVNFFDR